MKSIKLQCVVAITKQHGEGSNCGVHSTVRLVPTDTQVPARARVALHLNAPLKIHGLAWLEPGTEVTIEIKPKE